MTVGKLIDLLRTLNPNAEVEVSVTENGEYTWYCITTAEGDDEHVLIGTGEATMR